jgi:uncharacterized membrane protein (DUF485 family)
MFTEAFLVTTDPNVTLSQVWHSPVLVNIVAAIVFHLVIYTAFFNLASAIFTGKLLSAAINQRIVLALLVIMTGGYLARIYHVKDIYRAYRGDTARAREHVNKLFISWIFIG